MYTKQQREQILSSVEVLTEIQSPFKTLKDLQNIRLDIHAEFSEDKMKKETFVKKTDTINMLEELLTSICEASN